jgi:zinc transporter 9
MAPPAAATMDPVTWLLLLCTAMFVGAFGSGYIPLYFSWSERRLRLVTIFGAGLLVGTALVVIIPEGVAMHYEGQARRAAERAAAFGHAGHDAAAAGAVHSHTHAHAHGRRLLDSDGAGFAAAPALALASSAGSAGVAAPRTLMSSDSGIADTIASLSSGAGASAAAAPPSAAAASGSLLGLTPAAQAAFLASSRPEASGGGGGGGGGGGSGSGGSGGGGGGGADEQGAEFKHEHPGHYQIGAALAIGFAFQLVVDRMSGNLHSHTAADSKAVVESAADRRLAAVADGLGGAGGAGAGAGGAGAELNVRANTGGDHSAKSKSAMAGMVVHNFVDGVALGAAVREGDSALGMLVFLAIMLHKA